MNIEDLLRMTDKEVKKYVKQCGINSIEELYNSKSFIEKLELSEVGIIGMKKDVELSNKKAVLRTYHRNQINGLKVSIYYNYSNMPNTPPAELILRLYNNAKGRLGTVHWEESYNGFIYKLNNQYFNENSEDLYIWKLTKYSDFKRPWDYLEALKEERKSLDPLLTEATNALYNGDLDSLFLMYTGEKINRYKNQFHAANNFTTMIYKGAINNLSLEDAFVCYVADLLYDKQYSPGEFNLVKQPIIDYINNVAGKYRGDVIKYLDNLYSDADSRETIKKILLSNVDKEILKHEALRRLEKQKDLILKEFGLDPNYFSINVK